MGTTLPEAESWHIGSNLPETEAWRVGDELARNGGVARWGRTCPRRRTAAEGTEIPVCGRIPFVAEVARVGLVGGVVRVAVRGT